MANITILPAGASRSDVWAFDTGPGNVWIDAGIRSTFGKRFDTDGHIARAGRVIPPMFQECTSFPYYAQDPPKSTGREVFSESEARRLITKYSHPSSPLEDVVTTMTEVTAWSIADHIKRYAPLTTEIIVSGGGSQNSYLLERIESLVEAHDIKATVTIHEHWDAKEAMAFAYLGWLTINGETGNLPRVTGASRAVILGSIAKV
jgi:anhydro-N-acetylmuramic acid kinase